MDSNSFIENSDGYESLLVNPKETRFRNLQNIFGAEKYKCKVVK
jgi:hypothetical protein